MEQSDSDVLASIVACPGEVIALAPMDGVTDAVTRDLITDYNRGPDGRTAVSLCASEFVRVTAEPGSQKVLLRDVPELRGDGRTPAGVPVFVQLLGGQPAPMAETARRAVELGARGIDINFGCPAKTVNRHDGGATLLKFPERMTRIVAAVREAIAERVPLSVKIRTGWDSHARVSELALAAERGGAQFLTIHGRTRMELYKPPANLRALASAREAVCIPVIANGDLFEPQDFAKAKVRSGCDAFMVGRGAMAQPNLFCQVRFAAAPLGTRSLSFFLERYAEKMVAAGVAPNRVLGRLKNWVCLGSKVDPGLRPYFDAYKRAASVEEALGVISGWTE